MLSNWINPTVQDKPAPAGMLTEYVADEYTLKPSFDYTRYVILDDLVEIYPHYYSDKNLEAREVVTSKNKFFERLIAELPKEDVIKMEHYTMFRSNGVNYGIRAISEDKYLVVKTTELGMGYVDVAMRNIYGN